MQKLEYVVDDILEDLPQDVKKALASKALKFEELSAEIKRQLEIKTSAEKKRQWII